MIALPDLGFDKCHMIKALEVFVGRCIWNFKRVKCDK